MAHVTVSDTTPRATYAPSTGTTGPFAVNFTVFDPSTDLTVYVGGTLAAYNASPSTKLQYSWSGSLIDGGYNSGTITLGAACGDDEEIVIERTVAIARSTDFTYPSSTLNIQALNTQIDQAFAIIQQTSSKLDNRTLRQPTADLADLSDLPAKASRASKLLGFDSDGDVSMYANDSTSVTLAAIADLIPTDGNIIVGDGSTWVAESGATARASLGVTSTADLASNANAKGASLIGIEDAAGDITATTVEGALAENRAAIDAIEADYVTLTGAQTLSNKTLGSTNSLNQAVIVLPQGTTQNPTTEGDIRWDTDEHRLRVGTGGGTETFRPATELASNNNGFGASLIGIEDAAGNITATTVEGALAELAVASSGGITRGTAQATTSGTAIDFTSIAAGANRITVMFKDVSLSGSEEILVQIGDAGGLETTGYDSIAASDGNQQTSTAGFLMYEGGANTDAFTGVLVLTRLDGNTWVANGQGSNRDTINNLTSGSKTLSAELDRLTILDTSGDSFDAGSVNIFVG